MVTAPEIEGEPPNVTGVRPITEAPTVPDTDWFPDGVVGTPLKNEAIFTIGL